MNYNTVNQLKDRLSYFFFEKEFSGPRLSVLGLLLIPLVAYPSLADYQNTATVSASSDQFESDTTNNSDTVQVTPNAEIVIVKEVVNNNGGNLVVGDFGITTNAGALTFDSGTTVGDTTTYTSTKLFVVPGTYTLVESDVIGYTEGVWSCIGDGTLTKTDFDDGELVLATGESAVCTISNDDIGPQVTLAKTLTNDNGGDLGLANFNLQIAGNPATNLTPQTVAANTNFVISEDLDAGYTSTPWACVDGGGLTITFADNGDGTANLNVPPGADVTCSITNDDIAPTLMLVKNVDNTNGGSATPASFDLSISDPLAASPAISGVAYQVEANNPITISETPLAGYQEGSWVCTDANAQTPVADLPGGGVAGLATGAIFSIKQGSAVTCEITNTAQGVDLTIAKGVDDSTPNVGDTITFTMTVSNAGPDLATNVEVTDIILPGFTYVLGSMTGGTTQDESDPTGAGLNWDIASVPVGSPVVLTFDAVVNAP